MKVEIKNEDSISQSVELIKQSDREREKPVPKYDETGFPRRHSIKETFVYKCEKIKWLMDELAFELFGEREKENESDN